LRHTLTLAAGVEDIGLKPDFVSTEVNVGNQRGKKLQPTLEQMNLMA
jgi:hypothetical protein